MLKRNYCILLIVFLIFQSCKNNKTVKLNFLDEYVLQDSIAFNNTIIGGLSGLDYTNNKYYFVVDDAKHPRILKANIHIENQKIKSIDFEKVISLNDSISRFYKENTLDLESIFVDEKTNQINLVSEGSIKKGKLPSIFSIDEKGKFIEKYKLPNNLSKLETIKHNAAFEASSKSFQKNGFWVAMEGPLNVDGNEPTFTKTQSPVRITYFDNENKKATKQYAYQLDHISRPAKGNINLNGVTAILEYKENHFFIIERAYQNGYGIHGNTVKIYEAFIDDKSTNILEIDSLITSKYIPLKKRLIFNFDDIKENLTEGIVDNIEGITFGPKLANGNQSLLLVSDDNFQLYGKQLNQIILLEIQTN